MTLGAAVGPRSIGTPGGQGVVLPALETELAQVGAGGSLRHFHDRLPCYGSTPISVMGPEPLADLAKPLAEVRASAAY